MSYLYAKLTCIINSNNKQLDKVVKDRRGNYCPGCPHYGIPSPQQHGKLWEQLSCDLPGTQAESHSNWADGPDSTIAPAP